MADSVKLPSDKASHRATLKRFAAKGRAALRAQGMTDAEIDAAIDHAVGEIGPHPLADPHHLRPRAKAHSR